MKSRATNKSEFSPDTNQWLASRLSIYFLNSWSCLAKINFTRNRKKQVRRSDFFSPGEERKK